MKYLLPFVLCLALLTVAAVPIAGTPEEPLSETMLRIVGALGVLLPAALDDDAWANKTDDEDRARAVANLADAGLALRDHARGKEGTLDFLAASLAADAAMIRAAYVLGDSRAARYRIQSLTETCVACHSRLPDLSDSRLGLRITESVQIQELPAAHRASLLAATRQWEEALQTYEQLFEVSIEEGHRPQEAFWSIPEYIELCVRVRGDLRRPVGVLEGYVSQPEVPQWSRRAVREWIAALQEVDRLRVAEGTELEAARTLVETAGTLGEFPADRSGFVHYVAASSLLHRIIAKGSAVPAQLGEAYYLLGVTEAHIGVRGWLFLTEYYLEKALRLAPKASWAPRALAAFEFHLVVEFAGPDGPELPADMRALLDDLRDQVETP